MIIAEICCFGKIFEEVETVEVVRLLVIMLVCCCMFQLIYECKEVLTAAVQMKQYYIHMVGSVVTSDDSDGITLDIETYEKDLQSMLEVS